MLIESQKIIESKQKLLMYVFEHLNQKNIKYAVLHSYENLPHIIQSDIDMVVDVDRIIEVKDILEDILSNTNWRIIQYWQHESCAIDFVVSDNQDFIQLDFCTHYERNGRILIRKDDLLNNIKKHQNFYILDEFNEFIYILLKKVAKKHFSNHSRTKLTSLIRCLENQELNRRLDKYFSAQYKNILISSIQSNTYDKIEKIKEDLYKDLMKRTFTLRNVLAYYYFDFFRRVKRLVRPTGLFIVVLGVDGAGKSSVTQKIKQKYDAFREIRVYHSRLGIVKNLGNFKKNKSMKEAAYKNPHSHKKNSFFNSLLRFLYYFLDYFIGNILITYYKRRSKLIIIERYYYDYYIDKVRYKINLPDFLLKFFNLFVKKPDLIFILTGDTVKLYERKKEISIHQIDKQKKLLELHFGKRKDSIFIDTVNSDIDSTVNEIIYKCNSYMRNRMERFTRRNNHK